RRSRLPRRGKCGERCLRATSGRKARSLARDRGHISVAGSGELWPLLIPARGLPPNHPEPLENLRVSMHARFVRTAAFGLVFLATTLAAQAQSSMDPDGRFTGGQTSRRYEFFGGTSYVGAIRRTTVSAPGNYAPGTIIVNTAERRLYLVQD